MRRESGKLNQVAMRVVGIGGPGGQAVAQMAMAGLAGVDFVVVDTDRQRLTNTAVPTRIHYDPRALAGSARMTHALYTALQGADMLILIADLPGHDDALRTLLALGRTAGAVVVALAVWPQPAASRRAADSLAQRLAALHAQADLLFAVPVPRLALAAGASGAHACALHTQLQRHVGALHDLVAASSAIRIDPADLCTVAGNQTDVALATSYARGPRRAALAAQQLVQAPGDSLALREARQMLLKVTVGAQDSLAEVETAAHIVVTAQHPDANVILGVAVDETLADGLRLTAVAAGFPGRDTAVWRWRRLWQPHGRPQPLRHAFFDRADHFLRFLVRAVRV